MAVRPYIYVWTPIAKAACRHTTETCTSSVHLNSLVGKGQSRRAGTLLPPDNLDVGFEVLFHLLPLDGPVERRPEGVGARLSGPFNFGASV